MAYKMRIYVDGGCKGNGRSSAIGAAAAAFKNRWGKYRGWIRILPSSPRPTNQRAEITAIILALEKALEKFEQLDHNPYLDVRIYSDSKYAVRCMKKWIYKWTDNGWVNSRGYPVANRDLLGEASELDSRLREEGRVKFIWIPREKNEIADRLCNEALDRQ
jgi:ribonuclease HI